MPGGLQVLLKAIVPETRQNGAKKAHGQKWFAAGPGDGVMIQEDEHGAEVFDEIIGRNRICKPDEVSPTGRTLCGTRMGIEAFVQTVTVGAMEVAAEEADENLAESDVQTFALNAAEDFGQVSFIFTMRLHGQAPSQDGSRRPI